MMKVMIKGLAKDEMTLNKLGVVKGSKVMVIGSSLNDVLQVSSSPKEVSKAGSSSNSSKEEHGASKMKNHKKILDKGKPDDAMPARKSGKEPLPQQPLSGMLNKHGGKVRLTFKMDQGQVWIGKYYLCMWELLFFRLFVVWSHISIYTQRLPHQQHTKANKRQKCIY